MSNTSIYRHPLHTTQLSPTNKHGFTIVELLIVIVVIAILAAISVVAYNGIQNRAKDSAVEAEVSQMYKQGFVQTIDSSATSNINSEAEYISYLNATLKVSLSNYDVSEQYPVVMSFDYNEANE